MARSLPARTSVFATTNLGNFRSRHTQPFQEILVRFRITAFKNAVPPAHSGFIEPKFVEYGNPLFFSDLVFHVLDRTTDKAVTRPLCTVKP